MTSHSGEGSGNVASAGTFPLGSDCDGKDMQSKGLHPQYDLLTQNGILLESLAIHRWSQHNRMTSRYTATEEQRDFLFEMGEHFALFYNTKTTVKVKGDDN